jgi:hypothetical protein
MLLITGYQNAFSIKHLHAKTQLLPVVEHLSILCSQFLVSCLCHSHSSHETVKLPPGPRKNALGCPMKETLLSKFGEAIYPFLNDNGVIPEISYVKTRSAIHTPAVKSYIASTRINKVFGAIPPPIHPSEKSLPRSYHRTLAKLRSGKCHSLRRYQYFINQVIDDTYQSCLAAQQTNNHLFACSSSQTTLIVLDLWTHPVAVAKHISDLHSFNHLPPLIPPLLPPPANSRQLPLAGLDRVHTRARF